MLYDRSADVEDCPNEACRGGFDTELNRKCQDCEGSGYVTYRDLPWSADA